LEVFFEGENEYLDKHYGDTQYLLTIFSGRKIRKSKSGRQPQNKRLIPALSYITWGMQGLLLALWIFAVFDSLYRLFDQCNFRWFQAIRIGLPIIIAIIMLLMLVFKSRRISNSYLYKVVKEKSNSE